jgi:hypothetical protein
MARIRTIKPEFCTSEQIVECSTNARLLFVCMLCFCDDAGRHPANTKRLKMEVFPGDNFENSAIRSMVNELLRVGLLTEYTHEKSVFWQVTGWKKHQKIDRPSYKYPPFGSDGKPIEFDEGSTNVRRVFDDHSPPEGNGMESKEMEGNINTGASLSVTLETNSEKAPKNKSRSSEEAAESVFDWKKVPEGVNHTHWLDWLKVRHKKNATNTDSAWGLFSRECHKAGLTIANAVQVCAERGWAGFEAEWVAKDAKPSNASKPKTVYRRPTKEAS